MLTPGRSGDLRVALLTSRRAPGLERLLARARRPGVGWRLVAAVVSDPAGEALPALASAGVPAHVHDLRAFCAERGARLGSGDARRAYDAKTAGLLAMCEPDLLVLCGWLWIVTGPLLERYASRAINVHDSDLTIPGSDRLPRYRGLRSTREAIAAGELETRSTVHIVTEEVDVGPLVTRSWAFPVHPMAAEAQAWDAKDLLSAYAYAHREWMMRASWGALLERAIARFARDEVRVLGGKAVVAGALGPEDLEPEPAVAPRPGTVRAVAG